MDGNHKDLYENISQNKSRCNLDWSEEKDKYRHR